MYQTIMKVKYWDDIDNIQKNECFFIYSQGLEDAADQIIAWLGDDCIDEINIVFGSDTMLKLDENMENKIKGNWE